MIMCIQNLVKFCPFILKICSKNLILESIKGCNSGPYKYQKALYTGKHFYLPKNIEKTHATRGLYVLLITTLCVLDNKDVYRWQRIGILS